MFSNLKKKLQKEGGVLLTGENGGSLSPGGASPVSANSSFGSLQDLRESRHNGLPEEKVSVHHALHENGTGRTESDVSGQLARKTEQCKKLEAKISELAASIKEKVKHIERLTSEGEKRDQDHRDELNDLQTRQDESEVAMREMFQEALKRKEEENVELSRRLTEAEAFKSRSLKRNEETEEMQDFTTQELAKVKHMLINTQTELATAEGHLRDKSVELTKTSRVVTDLETHIEALNIEIAHHKSENEKFDGDRLKVNTEVQTLRSDIVSLQQQISRFKIENQEKSASLALLEEAHANLLGDHQALQRNAEVYKNKTSAAVNEKEEEIRHLQDRVETLEQRVQDCDLTGDEQIEALKTERDSLEQKLTDLRQQLTESKQKSTERISHLEDKISHLNARILDDHEELTMNEKAADNMRENFHVQLEAVNAKLADAERRQLQYADTLSETQIAHEKAMHAGELEMKKLRQYSAATERELQERVAGLQGRIDVLQAEKTAAEDQICDLNRAQDDLLSREADTDRQLAALDTEKLVLLAKITDAESERSRLLSQLDDRKRQLDASSQDKSTLVEECENLKDQVEHLHKSLKTKQEHYIECNKERDKLSVRNAELTQEVDNTRRSMTSEKRELETELTSSRRLLESLQTRFDELKEKCEDLESERNMVMVNIESTEVSRYKETVQALEEQLAEKNKTVKVLQQRLADLKKTLQRELKVQSLPNDQSERPGKEVNEQQDSRLAGRNDRHDQSPTIVRNQVTMSANDERLDSMTSSSKRSLYSSSNQMTPCAMTSSGATKMSCDNVHHQLSDVNLCYLKHVLLKFLLSRESESIHLVKAISTLLKFSRDEQKLVKETLEYKMSWFARKPSLGKGQQSKAIPPSW